MGIDRWFSTFVYREPLFGRRLDRWTAELAEDCRRVRDMDDEGRRWAETNYPGGYTSYATLAHLHRISSSFAELEQRIDRHVGRFARHLDYDLGGGRLEMVDCWVNIMPRLVAHGSHVHPLSVISGTFYVVTPPGASPIKFEDPRLGFFMGQPPRRDRCRPENKVHVAYPPEAGTVVLFESWLRHEVAANRSDAERISVSFNYQWLPASTEEPGMPQEQKSASRRKRRTR